MKIEILEDVLEELANKLDIYGCCKPDENEQACITANNFCCRVGFMMHYEDRIRQSIVNEQRIVQAGI